MCLEAVCLEAVLLVLLPEAEIIHLLLSISFLTAVRLERKLSYTTILKVFLFFYGESLDCIVLYVN